MTRRVVALRKGFDDRRNTSRVFAVPPQAIEAARRSQETYEREQPAWWQWLDARRKQEHRHDLQRSDGSPACCPVHGCEAVQV